MTTTTKIKTAILSVAISVASSTTVLAQDHDNSKAPHGGSVEEAGAYHIEALVKDGKACFYLLDGKAKSMPNKGVTGNVVLQFADGTTKTVQLTAKGTDGFMADDAKATTYTNAMVTFKTADKTATAKFKNHAAMAKYACPMHPEVTSDKAGKCSKCGMDLVENKSESKPHNHKEGEGHHH